MSTITKSPFARPTSVMSLLAEQMESSYIGNKSQPIEFKSVSKQHSNISSSAPTHRHSIPGVGFNCIVTENDSRSPDSHILTESDLSSPQLPPKRLCHSTSTDGLARPIPIKGRIQSPIFHNIQDTVSQFQCHPRPSFVSCPRSNIICKTPQKSVRPIISPHYKKSAFTPTRSLTSPQTTSSDYSMSPEIESPIYRPTSRTSSGFNDCSQQSLLIDPNYSPDSNQTSTCATIVNTRTTDPNSCVFPRCHSQPCDAPVLRSYNNRSVIAEPEKISNCIELSSIDLSSQIHAPMKRRYPSQRHARSTSQSESTNVNLDLSIHVHTIHKPIPNSADTSPNATGSSFAVPKRDGYFFGHSRAYLSNLPRIASSPPPISVQVDSQIASQGHRQRMGSNSSSLSTSTTTDANTPTIVSNCAIQRISLTDSNNFVNDCVDDVVMEETLHDNTLLPVSGSGSEVVGGRSYPWCELSSCLVPSMVGVASTGSASDDRSDMTTKSYSTTSDGTNASYSIRSECGSRSEYRDPDDPPDMIGFCFSALDHGTGTDPVASYEEHSSFQEIDLDQIELD